MTPYPEAPIAALINAIEGDSAAFHWLLDNNFPELALFAKYMLDNENEVHDKLMNSKHKHLIAFADALHGDIPAVNFLLANKHTALAAIANAVRGDQEALKWLLDHDLPHYAKLSGSLYHLIHPKSRRDSKW